jgi:hypothetical protein
VHIYPSVLQALVGGAMRNVWRGDFTGYWGEAIQNPACELPRKSILETVWKVLGGVSSGAPGRRNGPLRPTFVAAKRSSDAPEHRPGDFPTSKPSRPLGQGT